MAQIKNRTSPTVADSAATISSPARSLGPVCCASTEKQSAKSMAEKVRTVVFLFMFPCCFHSTLLTLPFSVAVGTALASGPPHGSVREEFPHTALTSGSSDGQPLVGIEMQNARGRKPVANQSCHVLPSSATKFLTAPS